MSAQRKRREGRTISARRCFYCECNIFVFSGFIEFRASAADINFLSKIAIR